MMLTLAVETKDGRTLYAVAPRDEPKFRRLLYWMAETGVVDGVGKFVPASEFKMARVA